MYILERVNEFIYLGYTPYQEVDISNKIAEYTQTMGVINNALKPSLVQKHMYL